MPRTFGGGAKSLVDVESLLDATTMELLGELVRLGALVSFGCSRDGGALSVHVRAGDVRDREWFRTDDELHEWLTEGVALIGGVSTQGPSNVKALRAP